MYQSKKSDEADSAFPKPAFLRYRVRYELQRPHFPRTLSRGATGGDTPHFPRPLGWRARDGRAGLALQRLGAGGRHGRDAAPCAQGQAHHLPFPKWSAFADGPLRPEARDGRATRRRPPSQHPPRAATHDDDFRAVEIPRRAEHLQVCAAREKRRVVQRTYAAHEQAGGRVDHHPLDEHGGHQSRPRHHLYADGLTARRAAKHRLLGGLRARQRKPRFARVCRAHVVWQRAARRPTALRPAVERGLPPVETSGRKIPQQRRPRPLSLEPARHGLRDAPRDAR